MPMIQGFEPGTSVTWNLNGTLTTGTVRQVIRQSGTVEVNGEPVHVEVSGKTPAYVVEHHTGEETLKHHTEVTMKPPSMQ